MPAGRIRLRGDDDPFVDLPSLKMKRPKAGDSSDLVPVQPSSSQNFMERSYTPPPSTPSMAVRDTPYRQSSSHPCSIPTHLSHSSQGRAVVETLSPVASAEARKMKKSSGGPCRDSRVMQHILRGEINGAVYHYPEFCREFFHTEEPTINEILGKIEQNDVLQHRDGRWIINQQHLQRETPNMHHTCAKLLDTIVHAAFRPDKFRPLAETVSPGRESHMQADHSDDSTTSPDIVQGVLCEIGGRHWGDLEFFAECKTKSLEDALMQIARYSRSTFTHQIYRRHIYSIAFCGTQASFVRISRSDIIHSPPIDLATDAEQFVRSAAGLFALDDSEFGYNTLFYYWPALKTKPDETRRELRVLTGNWRWVVVEILCHRMCLIGRATVVLLLRRVGNPLHHAVLKLIWRPNARVDESESLLEFEADPAICRCRWNLCGESTEVRSPSLLEPSPAQRNFFAFTREDTQILSESEPRQKSSTTAKLKQQKCRTHEKADVRHYSMILMDEGVGLRRIKHLGHLLRVLRDGIVACALVTDRGKVHRDISAGNILCRPRDITDSGDDFWDNNSTPESDEGNHPLPDGLPDRYDFEDTSFLVPEQQIESPKSVHEYIATRYATQKPLGSLFDFEFMVQESREENQVRLHADRTGTVAFMSSEILNASASVPVVHGFLHDLESFFWVFLWVVFMRAKALGHMSSDALEDFDKIYLDPNGSGSYKFVVLNNAEIRLPPILGPIAEQIQWHQADRFAIFFAKVIRGHLSPPADDKGGTKPSLDSVLETKEPAKSEPQAAWSREAKWQVFWRLIQGFDQMIMRTSGNTS